MPTLKANKVFGLKVDLRITGISTHTLLAK